MRIPNAIDLNTLEAYKLPPNLKLANEAGRRFKSEDFTWDEKIVQTLRTLSLQVIAQNFEKRPIYNRLIYCDRMYLLELLSTDLDLELCISLIEPESYWKRRYEAKFPSKTFKRHLGWTWKCVYLEQHISTLCENAQPQYHDEESFENLLNLCSSYVHILYIKKLCEWNYPKTLPKDERPTEKPISHINFVPILSRLPNITELQISYGYHEIGDNFDWHMFKIDPKDFENLGSALQFLTHLKILKINRCWLGDDQVQPFTKKLLYNRTLHELDLAYCKIGDSGAKCLGMLLNTHECLKILNLRGNLIQEDGALGLAWALLSPEGTYLKRLDLSLNPLGHQGVWNILRALVRGPTPKELSLAGCAIQGQTAWLVGKMIAINTSLNSLDLSANILGELGGQTILESLEQNKHLLSLDLTDSEVPEDILNEIKHLIKRNVDEWNLEKMRGSHTDLEVLESKEPEIPYHKPRKSGDFKAVKKIVFV